MDRKKYKCPKCGSNYYETSEMRATGSFVTKLFNIQNKKFTTITCSQCKYTELYAAPSNQLGNILDFFTN
ncbi:MAG: zinc ribbon domain-containing protein [Bacteroidales bacterium]|nr:zinc ribbon domain-containing protein [Bacteroidales bacterium]